MQTVAQWTSFDGRQSVHTHASADCACDMTFAVFLPPPALTPARDRKLPVVWYLSGLTCTYANVMEKGEYRRTAAELGLIVVCPDTSPRGADVPDEKDNWQFGSGAGFYLDATEAPFAKNYRMYSYVTSELPALIEKEFPADMARQGIFGHSMGGHGALTLALRHPGQWRSVSAFAPICAPSQCPWGEKAFTGYLGPDRAAWASHDACELLRSRGPLPCQLLVDQGLDDKFLAEQLKPELLEAAAEATGQRLTLRRHAGYDHSYWFIQTFVADHVAHHAQALGAG